MEKVKLNSISREQLLNAWAEITIKILKEKLTKMKVRSTGELAKSIQYHLVGASGGDISKIQFLYNKYGMFVDMGVGNGKDLGSKQTRGADKYYRTKKYKPRTAKVWYSKTMYSEVIQLSVLLADYFGEKTIATIKEGLPNTLKLEM